MSGYDRARRPPLLGNTSDSGSEDIELHYRDSTVAYGMLAPLQNAEALLYVIRDGLEVEKRTQQRLESGKLEPEDLEPPPAV